LLATRDVFLQRTGHGRLFGALATDFYGLLKQRRIEREIRRNVSPLTHESTHTSAG